MLQFLKAMLVTALAASLLLPATAVAKQLSGKDVPRVVVYPNYPAQPRKGPYGFLPGYREPLPLTEWRDRATRYVG